MTEYSNNAYRLLQLFDQMRDKRLGAMASQLNELNLSLTHVRALRLIAHASSLAMKDLAEQLCLTPPSVTAATRRLIQSGLIHRESHSEDSRVALLSLTSFGQSLLEEISREQLKQMDLLLQGLSPDEQEQFLKLLERAVRTLRAEPARG